MPQQATSTSARAKGWYFDQVNGRLAAVYNGTEVFDFDANDMSVAQNLTAAGTFTSTGVATASAELRVANGFNIRVGTISAFGTTEPTNWIVFRSGTQPAGTITTAGGIGADNTTVQKIVAGGTIDSVQT